MLELLKAFNVPTIITDKLIVFKLPDSLFNYTSVWYKA